MKILNTSNFNGQNFSGLWGKTTRRTDFDNVLCVPRIKEVRYYYPFVDETPEEIDAVVNDKKKAFIVDENGFPKYRIFDCKLGKKLPFNQQQYDAYSQLTEIRKNDKSIEEIHSKVREKYINDIYGNQQLPAYNPIIEEKNLNTFV